MLSRIQSLRWALTPIAVILTAAVLLPPGGIAARHYVYGEAIQFLVLAVVAPALLVLGGPWRLLGERGTSLLLAARERRPRAAQALIPLIAFIALALLWRLPVTVNALVRYPLLVIAEAITLIGAGCALWLEIVPAPPLRPRTTRPQRAALAAFPMWTIWITAYIMGFSRAVWFTSFAQVAGHGMGMIADQEIAAILLWVVPGLAFVPVVYYSLIAWLRDNSARSDERSRSVTADAGQQAPALRPPRPPRGWRLPEV
ncbi:MAG: cytochrome c oxidase assembly protein [Streptosporangiaceae bacterium]